MVAQIDSAGVPPEEPDAHRFFGQNAGIEQAREHALKFRPRPKGVGEHAAGDTPRRGALERRDDASCRSVVGKDIEQQVYMVARHVDVGDDAVDRAFVVGEDLGRVAAENRKVAQVFRQRDGVLELRANVRTKDVLVLGQAVTRGFGQALELAVPLQPPRRQRGTSDQQVQDQAGNRFEKDQQQPPLGCIRRAAKRHDHDHRQSQRPFGHEEDIQPEFFVVEDFDHVSSDPVAVLACTVIVRLAHRFARRPSF